MSIVTEQIVTKSICGVCGKISDKVYVEYGELHMCDAKPLSEP